MQLALIAMLPLLLTADQTPQKARTTPPAPATTATVTVTDLSGAPIADVRVTMAGPVDRSGSTQTNGIVKFDTLRPGVYRLRFAKDDYVLLEREFEWRSGQPAPNPAVSLSPAPASAAPPPAPAPAPAKEKQLALPPPGKPMTLAVPDYIERNFISASQPQKVSQVGCSGLANTLLWQIRESWDNRQHANADAMLYVIGGDGSLRLDGRDVPLQAGGFASIPRGTTYALSRRGRNPLIVLATLAGEPCQ